MKKTIITVLLALVTMAGFGQVKCYIEGELRDTTQGRTVVICPSNVDIRLSENFITAEADAEGHFSCDVETDKMSLYNVFLHEQWKRGSFRIKSFLVENAETVSLCFDNNTWHIVSGGPEQALKIKMEEEGKRLYISKMDAIEKQAKEEIKPRMEALQAQGKNPEEDSLLMKRNRELMAEYQKLYDEFHAWELEYYAVHPMLYTLYDMANQMQYNNYRHDERKTKLMNLYHSAYENFHPENPIHNTILTLEAAWKLKPGKPYIDFEARTADGEKVQVSSLYLGKVAVIDLWASWCGPCRQHSRELIPLYEKYKDKGFTVIAIARERSREAMENAAKKDGYPWPSLLELNDENQIWRKNGANYGGGAMFLIDRDGTILSTSTDAEELEPLIKKALNIK